MTLVAAAGAIEVLFTGLGVADENLVDMHFATTR